MSTKRVFLGMVALVIMLLVAVGFTTGVIVGERLNNTVETTETEEVVSDIDLVRYYIEKDYHLKQRDYYEIELTYYEDGKESDYVSFYTYDRKGNALDYVSFNREFWQNSYNRAKQNQH